jgi:hypothetical protein
MLGTWGVERGGSNTKTRDVTTETGEMERWRQLAERLSARMGDTVF